MKCWVRSRWVHIIYLFLHVWNKMIHCAPSLSLEWSVFFFVTFFENLKRDSDSAHQNSSDKYAAFYLVYNKKQCSTLIVIFIISFDCFWLSKFRIKSSYKQSFAWLKHFWLAINYSQYMCKASSHFYSSPTVCWAWRRQRQNEARSLIDEIHIEYDISNIKTNITKLIV